MSTLWKTTGGGSFRNWPHGRTHAHNKNKKAHRVPEYAVARQQVPDDAADDGAAVDADAHVQTAQMESGGDLRRRLGSSGGKKGTRRVNMKRGSGKEQMGNSWGCVRLDKKKGREATGTPDQGISPQKMRPPPPNEEAIPLPAPR